MMLRNLIIYALLFTKLSVASFSSENESPTQAFNTNKNLDHLVAIALQELKKEMRDSCLDLIDWANPSKTPEIAFHILADLSTDDELAQEVLIDLYEQLNERCDADAMYTLAFLHFRGYGAEQDIYAVYDYLNEASSQNHCLAQFKLGCLLLIDQTLDLDLLNGVYWLQRAALNGVCEAQIILNEIYHYIAIMAEAKSGIHQYILGCILYNNDQKSICDIILAIQYLKAAKSQGIKLAAKKLSEIYQYSGFV